MRLNRGAASINGANVFLVISYLSSEPFPVLDGGFFMAQVPLNDQGSRLAHENQPKTLLIFNASREHEIHCSFSKEWIEIALVPDTNPSFF